MSANPFITARRQRLSLSQANVVKTGSLPGDTASFPLVFSPGMDDVGVALWAAENREQIERELLRHGALLFRGFTIDGVEGFEQFARAVSSDLLNYRERSSPRSEVMSGVYTSTDYPANQSIRFHNEQSYTHSWPMKLYFYCVTPAAEGGATPIADGRKVLADLDAKLKQQFIDKRVMYLRNYGYGMGLDWQTAFQTTSKSEVETYCRRNSIACEWKDNGRLRTRQLFDTIVQHPKTNEDVWFEHAAFFHVTSLQPEVRDSLLAEFKPEDLPFNTYYGDGSEIEDSVLEEIRAAYSRCATRFAWRKDDVLLIDNMLTSHSREPFSGPRKIVVAMAELYPVTES
ncbi:MAG: TauD/TfdA family dioxygenase [Acidobacteria bacterium]|nr:TauD/TfdA family dioxygenase [Acidobacteriota bacterium]